MSNPAHTDWHPGETRIHELLGIPLGQNPTIHGLPRAYGMWMAESPLLALGTVDQQDRVWTTVLGGRSGVTMPVAPGILAFSSPAHLTPHRVGTQTAWRGLDPVLDALFSPTATATATAVAKTPTEDEELRARTVEHADTGKLVAGLAINLEDRTRVKLAGRMVKGIVLDSTDTQASLRTSRVDVRMAVAIEETLGNCPKYLNRKTVWPHDAEPTLDSDELPLSTDAVALVNKADIIFISTRHGEQSMDTNNRGGAPGFVRVATNSREDGVTLVYPEYSGNRLYQTLGNLTADSAVGITIPDFETGDVLYLSGTAEVLSGADAESEIPHSPLAVRVNVRDARFVRDGLPFRGKLLEPSPYNPPVRPLAREITASGRTVLATTDQGGERTRLGHAVLLNRVPLSPTISRYTFRVDADIPNRAFWHDGQHVTLDFSAHLGQGWSHMRDHDPASLNDDYIRSFTIVSPSPTASDIDDLTFEIIARDHGPVTRLLSRWTPGETIRASVLAFDGTSALGDIAREVTADDGVEDLIFVAGGVGVTPFLAAAAAIEARSHKSTVRLLWSLRADDISLVQQLLEREPKLGPLTELFVTDGRLAVDVGAALEGAQVVLHQRRMDESDIRQAGDPTRRRFILSAGRALTSAVQSWTTEDDVSIQSFDY